MGVFTKEMVKRGAYLYGSRKLGVAHEGSDYDWAIPLNKSNLQLLHTHGFQQDTQCGYTRGWRSRHSSWQPMTSLVGLEQEQMHSYRKGNTNVVAMSPLLFEANKYATTILETFDKDRLKDKNERIRGYQQYGQEYARLYKPNPNMILKKNDDIPF